MPHDSTETEIKLSVPDPGTARETLAGAGFVISRPRVFESNLVFDTPDASLRQGSMLLRLRQAGGEATVTYKGKPVPGKHKSREELEVSVSEAATMQTIFERLGYSQSFRYDKFRTEYRLPGEEGVATIDETPIGTYIELEGSPGWIDSTARRIGFAEGDYITASYARLYLEWCEKNGVRPSNMVFK